MKIFGPLYYTQNRIPSKNQTLTVDSLGHFLSSMALYFLAKALLPSSCLNANAVAWTWARQTVVARMKARQQVSGLIGW